MVNATMLVHNRPKLTQQALDSLGNHDGANVTIRLDKLSDKPTFDTVMPWKIYSPLPRGVLLGNEIGTGGARNAVIKSSEEAFGRGDYLYLSDNDVFFYPRWLETLIDCYEAAWSSGCRVLGGVGHPYHQHGATLGICRFNVRYAVQEVMAQPLQSMLMRWEVWDKYGPFCKTEPGRVCQSEDIDLTNKIRADGFKLGVVSPALVVNTGITNSFGEKIVGWELVQKECPPAVLCE